MADAHCDKPAIIYAAKSTEDRGGSIPAQLADARALAAAERWQVVGEYADESASAWRGDRGPMLAAAMEHAARVAPSVLVVQHSDRLARGDGRQARHLGEIYFWAVKADVELRSAEDDATFTNPLLTFAMGERNAEDSRRKSRSVAAGMKRAAQAGRGLGGPRPYGYRYPPDGSGILVVVRQEAAVVVRIFEQFNAGRSLSAIARELRREQVPTATVRGHWRSSTVGQLLDNCNYVGRIRSKGHEYQGAHQPIIDPITWQRTADLRAARPLRAKGRHPKGRHLFRGGMLRCGQCSHAMVPRTHPRIPGVAVYVCNGRRALGPDVCPVTSVRRDDIDYAVYRYFERLASNLESTRQQLIDSRERGLRELRAQRAQAEGQSLQAAVRLARVRRHYQDGRLSPEDWTHQRHQLQADQAAAKAETERLRTSEGEVERQGALMSADDEALRQLADIRRAITAEIQEAQGTDAIRAALSRPFKAFVLHHSAVNDPACERIGFGWWLQPILRDDTAAAGRRRHEGRGPYSARHLFGPIAVGHDSSS